jgi:peptidoglycan/xylan/chitin deacetylase (PgdA/CDA1 family)
MLVSAASGQSDTADMATLATGREVAVTIDDLPIAYQVHTGAGSDIEKRQSLTRRLLAALTSNHVPAIGFVNEVQLQVAGERDARVGLLQQWMDAGMTLGNHSYSHQDFNKLSVAEFEDEVVRGEVVIRQLMKEKGHDHLYFRFPFNHTGATRENKEALEAFLASRNYINTPFTVEHLDYIFNKIWLKARNADDTALAGRIRAAYLDYLDSAFDYAERRSVEIFGTEIKQIFLIHANELNADCMQEMIERLRHRGYRFITLEQALQDKAYQTKDNYVGKSGISWLHRWAKTLGIEKKVAVEPEPPQFIADLWNAKD